MTYMPPEDRYNLRTDPCGCELVRIALPGNPWRHLKRCTEHQAAPPTASKTLRALDSTRRRERMTAAGPGAA